MGARRGQIRVDAWEINKPNRKNPARLPFPTLPDSLGRQGG